MESKVEKTWFMPLLCGKTSCCSSCRRVSVNISVSFVVSGFQGAGENGRSQAEVTGRGQ